MASRQKYTHRTQEDVNLVPFADAEEAWFWFVTAQTAKNEGARYVSGQSVMPRPCEPNDILKVVDRLYRNRRLLRDHLLVLRHYGLRNMPPDWRRTKEQRAHHLWKQAMERIEPVLQSKGIVQNASPQPFWEAAE